ncbi:hypothetical protein D3C87_81320 [compost metagenome]
MGEAKRRFDIEWNEKMHEAFERALENKEVMWSLSFKDFSIKRNLFFYDQKNHYVWDFMSSSNFTANRVFLNRTTKNFEIYGQYAQSLDFSYFLREQTDVQFEYRSLREGVCDLYLKNPADVVKIMEHIIEKLIIEKPYLFN